MGTRQTAFLQSLLIAAVLVLNSLFEKMKAVILAGICLVAVASAFAPIPDDCGPVCFMYCPHGNKLDSKGCPLCACNPAPKFCLLKPETGRCRALKESWAWSEEEMGCIKFNYGGCEGNANNFNTKEECHKACGKGVIMS